MPAVLFEFGFMDNLREARLMLNVAFQKEYAQEVSKAVCEFYEVSYVPASKPVENKPASKPSSTPKKEESVQILTGGLNSNSVKIIAEYFIAKKWWGQLQFEAPGNPRMLSGGLDS
jgi:hypothetical protein